jgi:hypothetical protein
MSYMRPMSQKQTAAFLWFCLGIAGILALLFAVRREWLELVVIAIPILMFAEGLRENYVIARRKRQQPII